MQDRICDGDVESRTRTGSQNETDDVELEVVSQEAPNCSQLSGRHIRGNSEPETLDDGSIHSSRYSPNDDAVASAHSTREPEFLKDETGSIEYGSPSTILKTALIDIRSSVGTVGLEAVEAFIQDKRRGPTLTTRISPHDEPKAQSNPTTSVLDIDNNKSLRRRNVPLSLSDVIDVENQLRRRLNIPFPVPVDLNAIPDPPCPPFTHIAIIQLAIWSSVHRRLTEAQLWSRIEQRFSLFDPKTAEKWKVSATSCLVLLNDH
ncbi:Forkhead box protein D2 [Marasmius sp. AFHP31]|nr:Forkhead box protein D2 [Marasmius sp. AFHP31]